MKFTSALLFSGSLLICLATGPSPGRAIESKKSASAPGKVEEDLTDEEFEQLMDELEMIEEFELVREVDTLADYEVASKLPGNGGKSPSKTEGGKK